MIDTAIILAVGTPAHQSNLIQQRPRAMLPALGKPMVVRVMDRLYRAGIRRYIVVVGVNEGAVAAYLNRQWMPDTTIEFMIKSDMESLGLVLAKLARQLDRPFMIAGYNSFTYERFLSSLVRIHDESPDALIVAGGQMTLSPDAQNYYAILGEERIQSITMKKPAQEKHLVLTNIAIIGYAPLAFIASLTDEQASKLGRNVLDIANTYLKQDDAQVEIGQTSWILRVESDRELLTLNKRLLEDSNDAHILSELPYSVKIVPPVRVDPQVSVGQGVTLGPHVYVERGARIGYDTTIRNAIVMEHTTVQSNETLENCIVSSGGVIQL